MLIADLKMNHKFDFSHKYLYYLEEEYFKINFSNLFVGINNQKVIFIYFYSFIPPQYIFHFFYQVNFII